MKSKGNLRNKFSYLVLPDLNGNMRDSDEAISNFKSAFNQTTTVQQHKFSSSMDKKVNDALSPADIYRRASNNM
jgi:hypothetical protein